MKLQPIDALVIDDDPDAAESLASLLELNGYQVRFALSGTEALALLQQYKPMCVLLDFNMPGMDGLEIAKSLKQRYGNDVILIAVTGMDEGNERVSETFALVDHYFIKPISSSQFEKIFPPKED